MNGKIYSINDETFEKEVLRETCPVLVQYWASWSDPCQMISHALEHIALAYASYIKVTKLDVDESSKTLMKYGVQSVPTLMLFKNGRITATQVGALSKDHLITFIEGNVLHQLPFSYK